MKTKRSRLSWGGLALLLSGFLALSGFAFLPVASARADSSTPAYVRIIHASPFVGTADVFVDGNPFLTSFAFGAATDYAAVPPGTHKVQIALVGKGVGAAALTQTLAVQAGVVYTVAALGTSPSNLKLEVFLDDNRAASGTARLRFYQLSPNGGWITVWNGNQSLTGGNYQQASSYFTMGTGSNSFDLDSAAKSKSLSTSTMLQANTITSIFAVGVFGGTPSARVVVKQTAATPGLPQTGSDPNAPTSLPAPVSSGPSGMPWLLLTLALALAATCGTLVVRRFSRSR